MKILKWILTPTLCVCAAAFVWVSSTVDMGEVGIPYAQPAADDSGLTVRWLGIATLLFDDGETQIMTDGFISRPTAMDMLFQKPISSDLPAIEEAIRDHRIDRLKAIMPVHSHYDHAMDTADVARLTGADVLGSPTTANIARSSHLDESQIKIIAPGVPYTYGKFTVSFYESRHAPLPTNMGIDGTVDQPFSLPAPYTAWKEGQSYSIHISHPGGSAIVQGSAGFVPGALADIQADVVFLGSGGLMNLPSSNVAQYVDEIVHTVNPSRVYVIHQDNLLGEFGDVEQSKILPSFNKRFAFDFLQMVLPAELLQMHFGDVISLEGI
jgi:L-ascorbate metabolism protein UlaG (beta-lactamase superfamily)